MLRRSGFVVVLVAIFALVAFQISPAFAHHKADHDKGSGSVQEADHKASDHDGDADSDSGTAYTEDNDSNDYDDGRADEPNNVADEGDNAHPSGKDRSVENGGGGVQGKSESNPDDSKGPMRYEGELGADKPNGPGGTDRADQDGNNGCGNDDDFDDDNNGWCGKPELPATLEDEVEAQEIVKTCPAGTDNGGDTMTTLEGCDEDDVDVLGRTDTAEPSDDVLGKVIRNSTPQVAAGPAVVGASGVAAAPATLPFTGADLLPIALTGLSMIGAGTALARRKR